MKIKFSILFLLITTLFCSCKTLNQVTNRNLAFLYKSNEIILSPSYKIFHETDSTSKLLFNLQSKSLLYKKNDTTNLFEAKYKISFIAYESYESRKITDSCSYYYSDKGLEIIPKNINNSITMKIGQDKKGLLEINLYDLNKHTENTQYIQFSKSSPFSAENFYATTMDGAIKYNGWTEKLSTLKIHYRDNGIKQIFIKHYPCSFPIAAPPFVLFDNAAIRIKYDTIYTLNKYADETEFTFSKEGIFLIQTDTSKREGLPMIVFDTDYPKLTTPDA